MARGRFIENKICLNKKINLLSDDTSRLAYTWLITFADCEGRTYGDPALVRSMLFPRRTDVTNEQMAGYIQEWSDAGLIIWYEAEGDQYIYFIGFHEHQIGLNKSREGHSKIPTPPEKINDNSGVTQDKLTSNSGVNQEESGNNSTLILSLIKIKNDEEEEKTESIPEEVTELLSNNFRLYEDNIGLLTPILSDRLIDLETEFTAAWLSDAIKVAAENNGRSIRYIETVLSNWQKNGKGWKPSGKNGSKSPGMTTLEKSLKAIEDFEQEQKRNGIE